jgi:hypothetical protein
MNIVRHEGHPICLFIFLFIFCYCHEGQDWQHEGHIESSMQGTVVGSILKLI